MVKARAIAPGPRGNSTAVAFQLARPIQPPLMLLPSAESSGQRIIPGAGCFTSVSHATPRSESQAARASEGSKAFSHGPMQKRVNAVHAVGIGRGVDKSRGGNSG